MLIVNAHIRIPLDELKFSFARSSGPGGQNVNKVASKAVLRWAITASPSLPAHVRDRFVTNFRSRVTTEGDLVLSSQQFRDQRRNIEDCLDKLRSMLRSVATPPRRRKRTRPTRGSVERRLEGKRAASQKKRNRRAHGLDD